MARLRRSTVALGLLTSCFIPLQSATGSETISYSYDERGRLVKIARSGNVNNGVSACYSYDKAENRSNVVVLTPGDCSQGPPPSFAINDVSVTEGGSLVLTVTKTGATSSSFSVNFATANGTAAAGSDYTANSGTLTFAAAEATKTITVATIDDAAVESAETVLVNLSGATGGATITDSQGVGTINDNDVAPTCNGVSFWVNNTGTDEPGNLYFSITKSGSATISCSVNYATANGTAVSSHDYTAASGTLTFAANETSKIVAIPTSLANGDFESTETMYLNLSGATGGASIGDGQGIGTIYNYFPDDEGGGCPPQGCPAPPSGAASAGAISPPEDG